MEDEGHTADDGCKGKYPVGVVMMVVTVMVGMVEEKVVKCLNNDKITVV